MRRHFMLLCVLLLVSSPLTALAQEAPENGYRAEFLAEWDVFEDKLVSLAEAVPDETFSWRPAEGIRSFSEVFLHVAAANFNIPQRIDKAPPEGFQAQGYDTSMTGKDEVVEALRTSFEHVRSAVIALPDEAGDDEFEWFGGSTQTKRGLLLFLARHTSEHLGQSIAYARMNGITPPWSQ